MKRRKNLCLFPCDGTDGGPGKMNVSHWGFIFSCKAIVIWMRCPMFQDITLIGGKASCEMNLSCCFLLRGI